MSTCLPASTRSPTHTTAALYTLARHRSGTSPDRDHNLGRTQHVTKQREAYECERAH